MIIFSAQYPYKVKNETLASLCGIAPGATLELGPGNFTATRSFYANHAELAHISLISGELSAKTALDVAIDPDTAAAEFLNARAGVSSYQDGQQSLLTEAEFNGPVTFSNNVIDAEGAEGSVGQILSSSPAGTKWIDLSVSHDETITGAGTPASPLKVANPVTGTNTGDQVVDGTTIVGVGSDSNRIRANVPSTSDNKLYGILNGAYAESTKSHVGLSNVDNVQQLPLSYLSTDNTMGGTGASGTKVPSQLAAKSYADTSRQYFHLVNVQKNPQVGQFSSIAEAVNSITDSSVENPYVVYVRPGTYTEPLIDLSNKPGVQLWGSTIQGVIIEPDAADHHVIRMGPLNEVSFLSVQNAGPGYAGLAIEDSGYYSQAHKVSITDCSIGVLITSATVDTYFYGEYVDVNDNIDYGVRITATNGFIAYANLENFYVYPTVDNPTVGLLIEGPKSEATVTVAGFISDISYGGKGIVARDGADLSINASTFYGLDTSIHVPYNVAYAPCNIVIESVVLTDNTMDLLIEDEATTGFFAGAIEYSKKVIPFNAPFYQYGVDPKTIRVETFGGDFSSIAAAVDSITDATDTKRYIVKVGAGTFTEPLIDLSGKSYIVVQGADIQSTVVLPASSGQHLFKMGHFTELSDITIRDVGTGYAGVFMDDVDGWCLVTKASFYNCDTCVYVRSDVNDTYLYGETLDFNENFGIGIKSVSVSGKLAQADTSGSTFYPTDVTATGTKGMYASGAGSFLSGGTLSSSGSQGGIGLYLENGAEASISSGVFSGWDTAILVANIGAGPTLVTKATICSDNATWDLSVQHPSATGNFFGDMTSNKASVVSPVFGIVFQDAGTGGFTVSDKMNIRFSNTVTTDVSTLITETATMGLLSGGVLSPASGSLGATGLGVWVPPGMGYLVEQSSGFIKKVEWAGVTGILGANSETYIGVNDAGVVFTSPSIANIYNVRLGRALTNATSVTSVINVPVNSTHHGNIVDNYLRRTLGGIFGTGCIVSENGSTPRSIDVSAGTYYYGSNTISPSSVTAPSFEVLYRNTPSGWVTLSGETVVSNTNFDDGTGALATLTDTYFAAHTLYTTESGPLQRYWLVLSQAQYASPELARASGLPTVPSFIKDTIVPIAQIIVQKDATNFEAIVDVRTKLGFTPNSSSGVTVHGDLTGLSADDHTQYLLVSGMRSMTGDLMMGGHGITGVSTVNGVTVEGHASRHLPNGSDALATAAPATGLNGASTNSEGIQNSLSRSDHTHAISLNATDVGLGNVTNESKTTMFTSPVFTGTPAMSGVTGLSAASIGAEPFLGLPEKNNYVLTGSTGGDRVWVAQKDFSTTASDIKENGTQSLGILGTLPRADHVHPTDMSRAPLASPGFTGVPTAPTAARGTNTSQLATTSFVESSLVKTTTIGVSIDNGTSAITSSVKKAYMKVPYDCTITGWSIVTGGNAGSISVSLLKCTYASFPPSSTNNICGTAYITLLGSQKNQSSTGWDTGWSKNLAAGDILGVEVLASPAPTVYSVNVLVDILKS